MAMLRQQLPARSICTSEWHPATFVGVFPDCDGIGFRAEIEGPSSKYIPRPCVLFQVREELFLIFKEQPGRRTGTAIVQMFDDQNRSLRDLGNLCKFLLRGYRFAALHPLIPFVNVAFMHLFLDS